MTGKQQDGIFQFARAALDRVVAEIGDHDRGTDRNGHDQQNAANDEPANWIASARLLAVGQNAGVDRTLSTDQVFAGYQHFLLPGGQE